MKSLLLLSLCFATLAGFAGPLVAAKDKGLDVLISADAIPSPESFRPKPRKPIHYFLNQNRLTLGDAVANVKLPNAEVIERTIDAELKKQGFNRTEVGGPLPDIVILATVGDANFEQPRLSPTVNPLTEPDFEPYLRMVDVSGILRRNALRELGLEELFETQSRDLDIERARGLVLAEAIRIRERGSARGRDQAKIMALVGAPKVNKAVAEGAMSSFAADRIAWATKENRFYVTLSAFDAVRWKAKQQVLLWRTTMLIDWREDLSKSLAAMLAQAGPMFGTDVAVPGIVNTADTRRGNVEIGDATVVPDKDSGQPSAVRK